MKVGFCALYGLANAGKSTLLNSILGVKVEATSSKPQTTRENIQGIYNDDDSQIVFIETPGLHNPHKKLGSLLLKDASEAVQSVDVIIYVIDASLKVNYELCSYLSEVNAKVIACFNKIDLINLEEGQEKLKKYKEVLKGADFVEISALKKFGIDTLINTIKKYLDEGVPYFPKDMLIDHPTEFVYAEMIREKCMRLLDQEVPHAIHVEIVQVESGENDEGIVISANIIVEKESEKAIVIGKGGKMISKIRHLAEHSISLFTMDDVALELYVKVVKDWRNDVRYLKKYGYER